MAGSAYALTDGALGFVTGVLLGRRKPIGAPQVMVGMVLADAVLRVGAGLAIRVFPGVPGRVGRRGASLSPSSSLWILSPELGYHVIGANSRGIPWLSAWFLPTDKCRG